MSTVLYMRSVSLADRLRELREQAGKTQAQLAEAAGVPIGSLRGYEQGQREPQWRVLFNLAAALGVTCEAFADCSDLKMPRKKAPRRKT